MKQYVIVTLVMNLLIVLSMYFQELNNMGSMRLFIIVISSILFLGMSIFILRIMYFTEKISYKNKLLLSFMFTITMLNAVITVFAQVAYSLGLCSNDKLIMPSIIDSYYFSIVTFTTLGYGDFTPSKDLRLVFAGEALIGYIFFASIMGMIIALILKDERR